jgi:hypothetical protein
VRSKKENTTRKNQTRRVDNIEMDHLQMGWGGVDWIVLAQSGNKREVLVDVVTNLCVS